MDLRALNLILLDGGDPGHSLEEPSEEDEDEDEERLITFRIVVAGWSVVCRGLIVVRVTVVHCE